MITDAQTQPPFACTRRQFLPALLREALVTLGMLRGGQGARLADLSRLSDQQLACLRPIVNPACAITVDKDQVWARHKKTGTAVRLFAVEEADKLAAFNCFDGEHTLAEVGALLARERGWEGAQGFALARDLFLTLVGQGACLPQDPPWFDL